MGENMKTLKLTIPLVIAFNLSGCDRISDYYERYKQQKRTADPVSSQVKIQEQQQDEFVTIGTGGVTGVYYPTGGAICRLVNKNTISHKIDCSVESTKGSVYNINAIRSGEMKVGVAQSDWQYHAYNGSSKFSDKGPFKDLRAVMSVHPESFTVIARADSGIKLFNDIKGKRVNISNQGSGQRGTFEALMQLKGWTLNDFSYVSELKATEQSRALCDNKVDVIIYVVGHPSGTINEATSSCETVIVPVTGPIIDKFINANAFYRTATIPYTLYNSNNTQDIKTFGVGATVVTDANTSEKLIYNIVKAVAKDIETFRKSHPAFTNLKLHEMATKSLSAPMHPGAIKAFKEAGVL